MVLANKGLFYISGTLFGAGRLWRSCVKSGRVGLGLSVLLMAAALQATPVKEVSSRLYLNYSAEPHPQDLTVFDCCILDPNAKADLGPGHSLGGTFLAYISLVEVQRGSPAEKLAATNNVPFVGQNAEWGSRLLDITSPGWAPMIVEGIAKPAITKGYDGFFLDTIDSTALLAKQSPKKAAAYQQAVVRLIKDLHARFPKARIVTNRGFDLVNEISSVIDGVLVESVYETFDPATKRYKSVSPKDTEWIEGRIRSVQMTGLPVYAVDYVDPGQNELAKKTAMKLSGLGCVPFVTTHELHGTSLAPLREVPRRILVVFGWDPKFADKPVTWPIDTMTAEHLQTALEWMGYEVEYLDIGKKSLPDSLPSRFAGVILDEFLTLRPDQERSMANWLMRQKDAGIPILFAGDIPFTDDEIKDRLASTFGFTGSLRAVHGVKKPSVATLDGSIMNAETRVEPRSLGFKDVTAPPTAEVFLSIRGEDKLGDPVRFDPVFLAPWGGMWLEPYVVLRASQENKLFYADPFRFLGQWLASAKSFPAPDTTTRDGRRMIYSHIDGDGFASLTHFPGHPTCGEVIRNKILQQYPLPVTVSIVEADTRALLKTLNPDDSPRYENIARTIFALPNVQAASHSFTHPFSWDPDDTNPGHFDRLNVELNDNEKARYPKIDLEREIKGSIDYINERLLPPGKRVELMLWSGNCRPGARALEICRQLGVENMNGGDTILSRLYPSLSGVAPRMMPWGDEIQIFAANQNEFMYANGFQGPSYGGYADVIDTFQRTNQPRRLKPVNIYYHFYSSTFLSSLRALEKVHDWCMKQPLHPVTALEYAQIARDAFRSKIFAIGPDQWLISNTGRLRTLRVPASAGVPDLARCHGVSGYKTEGDVTYIHTTGRTATELVLTDANSAPQDQLRLVESSADVTFHELTGRQALFQVSGWSTVDVAFAGIPPGAMVAVTKNKEAGQVQAAADGTLKLSLPPRSTISLNVPCSPYAASR